MSLPKLLIFFLLFTISLINIDYADSQESISLSIDVYPKDLIASAGDEALIQINLIQLGNQIRRDVVVSLFLVDKNNKSAYTQKETVALETKASMVTRLKIPKDIKKGIYNINIQIFDINEENLLGKASEIIIIKNKITKEDIYSMGIYLNITFFIVFVIILYKHNRDFHRKHEERITKQDIWKYLNHKID